MDATTSTTGGGIIGTSSGHTFRSVLLGAIASFFVLSTAGIAAAHLIVEDESRKRRASPGKRRQRTPTGEKKKRKMIRYDRERAYRCVMDDWLGPVPRFDDKQYERHFRITRSMAQHILQHLAARDKYWRITADATRRTSIYPEVKLTMALKVLAYGVSTFAFLDYHQMGYSTARECVERFAKGVINTPELRNKFLRTMSPADARRVEKLHYEKHGVRGMVGSLDCMHVPWKNCPNAYKGQYEGKEGEPTIVLEAAADTNLWFWHVGFGTPGALNDINVWERSPLLQAFVDGTWTQNDFPYEISGEEFTKLYFLGE